MRRSVSRALDVWTWETGVPVGPMSGSKASVPQGEIPESAAVRARAHLDDLAICREHVAAFLRGHGAAEHRIEEVTLVVSELASNVVRHTDRATIDLTISAEPDRFLLELWGAPSADVTDAARGAAPPVAQSNGRGLVIAHAVADRIETVGHGGERLIRCHFHRHPLD